MGHDLIVIGGGPSGLAAAHEAIAHGARVTVLERLDRVGGLSRTLDFNGSRFDIGPHRFFTKNAEVNNLFLDVLGDDAIRVPRLTRILHGTRYFDYPLTPVNAMLGIGPLQGAAIVASYGAARARAAIAPRPIATFEDWVVDRFGRRLFDLFFKAYTEKVWGVTCDRIGADWAAQRIRGLSLTAAVANALQRRKGDSVKTLVSEFKFPRLGAGQVYEKMAAHIAAHGGRVLTGANVVKLRHDSRRVRAVVVDIGDGHSDEIDADTVLTSASLTDTARMMDAPPQVIAAAGSLRYRQHIGVHMRVEGELFPDNWIYVHSHDVDVARIANYRNFSIEMAGAPGISPITAEYFSSPGDEFDRMTDEQMIARAVDELSRIGIVTRDRFIDAFVTRSREAYPVMEIGYDTHVQTIRDWLARFDNLLPIGRAGMFKYNNQDHAMATGLLAARSVLGLRRYDPWLVNIDAEYHEGAPAT
jgi:protoporphyrinogen oxidase